MPRVPEPGTRPPARSLGVGRNARGAGRAGLAAQPERVREGAGQSPLERQLRTTTQSWGGGALASAGGRRDKQGGARESGRPPPPSQRGHCRSAPAPRPAAALAHRPPQPFRPPARPPYRAWEVPGPPQSPGCSAARSPRSSPRSASSSGAGRTAPARTARLGAAAAAAPTRPPGAAHRPAPLRPPARRGSVRAHLAGLPSLSGTLRSRTRPRPQPGPDSLPGRERRSAPASE